MLNNSQTYYLKAKKIRLVEEKLLKLFDQGKIFGTTHTSIGQELIPSVLFEHIKDDDYIFSNHRCHGHYVAYGGPLNLFFSEVMGKENGLCGGRGGSQHIHYKNFFSNGIQGGIVGNSTGLALSNRLKKSDSAVIVFLGDGTFGEGLVYESFNFASINKLKILFVVENNHYAMSTKDENSLSGTFSKKAEAFGIKTFESSTFDLNELILKTKSVFEYLHKFNEPVCFVIDTYRLSPHSKGDDVRDKAEILYWSKKDFINMFEESNPDFIHLKENILLIEEEINNAVTFAENDQPSIIKNQDHLSHNLIVTENNYFPTKDELFLHNLNQALLESLNDKFVFLLGEDLKDPYGGAFKVTKGLSSKFPNQVINTSISEAGIVSWAIGASLNGFKPIAEIMFGDFLTLAADQLVNHGAKYNWLYNNSVSIKAIIRTPMGGERGYGATHSQSLEKMFYGIPGLKIIAPNIFVDNLYLINLIHAYENSIILFIENKKMYSQKMKFLVQDKFNDLFYKKYNSIYPLFKISYSSKFNDDYLIICYSEMVSKATNLIKKLMFKDELSLAILVVTQISPLDLPSNLELQKYKKIFVIEEGTKNSNWGDYIHSYILENNLIGTSTDVVKLSSIYSNIPSAKHYEASIILSEDEIEKKIRGYL